MKRLVIHCVWRLVHAEASVSLIVWQIGQDASFNPVSNMLESLLTFRIPHMGNA